MGLIERLKADVTCLRGALRTLKMTTPIAKNPTRVFPQVIAELADKYGDAPALLSDRERFSYRELAARANRYARWALAQGINKGDTVCLMMPNRPEFLALWVGVTRVGGVVALLNTNLTGTALAHCINVVNPKHIIVAAELFDALDERAQPHHRRCQAQRSGCTATPTPTSPASIARSMRCPATSLRRPIAAHSRSRTARSTSTRRAPPACPRPPT